jgi:ribosome assembly protein YihI (activator of Der GTPase)
MDVLIKLELPLDMQQFKLPPGVHGRLQELLDRQDRGETLTASERKEAEGLVDLAEMLSLLGLRAQRAERETPIEQ